jgi:hypothetical protein
MALPDNDDVVVRPKRGHPATIYLVGTFAGPEQFILRTHNEAVSQAVVYAKHQHVRAWFDDGNHDFRLLGTFRTERLEAARRS